MVLHEDYIYSGRCTFPWPLTLSDSAFHLLRSNSPCKEKFGLCKRWWTCSQIPKNLRKRRDETRLIFCLKFSTLLEMHVLAWRARDSSKKRYKFPKLRKRLT